MSTTAWNIRTALESAVKNVTPTEPGNRFKLLIGDDDPMNVSVPSGMDRRFDVTYVEGKHEDRGYEGAGENETRETFVIRVLYPLVEDLRGLEDRMRSDLLDIRKAINSYNTWGAAYLSASESAALLHAFVPAWNFEAPNTQTGRHMLVIRVDVQFLESTV